MSLLVVDLDRFRVIGKRLGPAAGDELLGAVAGRLAACVRRADVVGRLSHDRFGVLLSGIASAADAATAAARMVDGFRAPFRLGTIQVMLQASVGLAVGGIGTRSADELLREAELALYRAKAEGGGRWATFEQHAHTVALQRFELEADLRRAVEAGEMVLEFQPAIHLAGALGQAGTIRQVEALVRWRHPGRGLIPPAEFVPIAEETGLIVPIGRWVLAEATRLCRMWQLLGDRHADLAVSVNLSPRQVRHPSLVQEIRSSLTTSGIAPATLILEVAEGALSSDGSALVPVLESLRGLGVRIALDDFGGAKSSVEGLAGLPLDQIKLDRRIVSGLGPGAPSTLARTLVHLGHALSLESVAVGIENRAQLLQMREIGCDLAQGFYFGKPLGPEGITALLRAERRRLGALLPFRPDGVSSRG